MGNNIIGLTVLATSLAFVLLQLDVSIAQHAALTEPPGGGHRGKVQCVLNLPSTEILMHGEPVP